jgi:uncharacterized linocin/CFP29 family protein
VSVARLTKKDRHLSGEFADEAYMLTQHGGDLELIVGQDIAIGYESHTPDKVKLYFTASCTFRVLEPQAVLNFTAK